MNTLLSEGIDLAVLGMGTVFVFLTLLVFATQLMSFLVKSLTRQQGQVFDNHLSTQVSPIDHELLVAVSAAVHRHREKNNN